MSGRQVALAVQQALVEVTGRSCGYGTLPSRSAQPTGAVFPYSVLYELGQTPGGPPFGDGAADATVSVQITSVGQTAEQASLMADKVREALLARSPGGRYAHAVTVPGCAVVDRDLSEAGATADPSAGVYSYVQRCALYVTTIGS